MPTVIKKINVYNGTSSSWNTYPIGVLAENINVAVGQDTKNLQEAINNINTAIDSINPTVALDSNQVTGTLPLAKGGTGRTSANSLAVNLASSVAGDPLSNSTIGVRGKLSADNLNGIPGEKITSGTIAAARVAALPASKITSGTFDAARIPGLNASKITAGTLSIARGGTGLTTKKGFLGWTRISSADTTGATKKTFTIPSGFSEVMITCLYPTTGSSYSGSVTIPALLISATTRLWYLGGGRSGTSTASLSGRRACVEFCSTAYKPVTVNIDGSTYNGNWRLYYR